MAGYAVVTISDRCAAGQQVDTTGPAVAGLLGKQWPGETVGRGLVPDNEDAIVTLLNELCNQEYDDPALRGVFESNPHVCMDLCFIHQLLSHGYGLTDSTSLQLAKKIKGYETGWCMGAMMKVLDEHDRFCN